MCLLQAGGAQALALRCSQSPPANRPHTLHAIGNNKFSLLQKPVQKSEIKYPNEYLPLSSHESAAFGPQLSRDR